MKCAYVLLAAALLMVVVDSAAAQAGRFPGRVPGTGGPGGPNGRGPGGPNRQAADEAEDFKLPEDPKLLKIHETFVLAAEKLAAEYERTNQIDKAHDCYTEILRLVPKYAPAAQKLAMIKEKEATAEKKLIDIYANKGWQDTGIIVLAGKPVSFKASGQWTLKMTYDLGPDGIEIPKELRDYPLGSLIGTIAESADLSEAVPFLVGSDRSLEPKTSGRLFLRIYDSETSDNLGRVGVIVEGTFKK